ncbi:MAG TPA: energy-coupling factor ABC transporter permease [bacterium]|nr:energy-coupling factor ABC transporter permease [bacterium]
MHISEGVLTGPSVVITDVLGFAAIAWGASSMRKFVKDQPARKPLLGMAGAFVFFVSLMHIPAFGGTTCSHPCGTPLAAILLGPGVTVGLAACGLLLQALFFAHGGISTLGANTLTLGLVGGGVGYLTFRLGRKLGWSLAVSAGLAGLVGDVSTYMLNIVILGLHFAYVAPHPQYTFWGYAKVLALAYLPVQGPLAIGEMFVTGYAIQAIFRQRPEVLESLGVVKKEGPKKLGRAAAVVLVALALLGAAGRAVAADSAPSSRPAAAADSVAPTPVVTYSALDDLTDGMAEKAGTPTKPYWIDLEGYHDIWSSLCMLAGLAVGFILGRYWHLLFIKEGQDSGVPAAARSPKKKRVRPARLSR